MKDLKASLRRELRQRRKSITPEQRRIAAWAVARQQGIDLLLRRHRRLAFYVPTGSEFPIWPLVLRAMQRGCRVYLPVVPDKGRHMHFVRLDHDSSWTNGHHGIPVPDHTETCSPRQLDTVFMPLLGFDAQFNRLGQGGGYYDCTFAFRRMRKIWKKPRLIGVAFACQEAEHIPSESWDLKLDAVLTEQALRKNALG